MKVVACLSYIGTITRVIITSNKVQFNYCCSLHFLKLFHTPSTTTTTTSTTTTTASVNTATNTTTTAFFFTTTITTATTNTTNYNQLESTTNMFGYSVEQYSTTYKILIQYATRRRKLSRESKWNEWQSINHHYIVNIFLLIFSSIY